MQFEKKSRQNKKSIFSLLVERMEYNIHIEKTGCLVTFSKHFLPLPLAHIHFFFLPIPSFTPFSSQLRNSFAHVALLGSSGAGCFFQTALAEATHYSVKINAKLICVNHSTSSSLRQMTVDTRHTLCLRAT